MVVLPREQPTLAGRSVDERRSLTCSVKTHHEDTHFFLAEEIFEQVRKDISHFAACLFFWRGYGCEMGKERNFDLKTQQWSWAFVLFTDEKVSRRNTCQALGHVHNWEATVRARKETLRNKHDEGEGYEKNHRPPSTVLHLSISR